MSDKTGSLTPNSITAETKVYFMENTRQMSEDIAVLKQQVSSLNEQLKYKRSLFQFSFTSVVGVIGLIVATVALIKSFF